MEKEGEKKDEQVMITSYVVNLTIKEIKTIGFGTVCHQWTRSLKKRESMNGSRGTNTVKRVVCIR